MFSAIYRLFTDCGTEFLHLLGVCTACTFLVLAQCFNAALTLLARGFEGACTVLALVVAAAGHLAKGSDLKSSPLPSRAENSAVVPAFASSTVNGQWSVSMAQF